MKTIAVTIRTRAVMMACAALLAGHVPAAASAAEPAAQSPVEDDGAAQLSIAPLRLELEGPAATTTLRITNPSRRPVPVQLRLFAWTQDGGEDRYAPSGDIVLSPSITSIPAGQTQVFRLVRGAAAGPGEKRYRVAIDQLPDAGPQQRSGVAEARIRFTVPVFVDRATTAPTQLAWRLRDDRLELANLGGQTARIARIEARDRGGRTIPLQRSGLRYVHGGSVIAWPLSGGCALGAVTVSAQVDDRTVDAQAAPACS